MFISLEVCLSSGLQHIVMFITGTAVNSIAINSIAVKCGYCATK